MDLTHRHVTNSHTIQKLITHNQWKRNTFINTHTHTRWRIYTHKQPTQTQTPKFIFLTNSVDSYNFTLAKETSRAEGSSKMAPLPSGSSAPCLLQPGSMATSVVATVSTRPPLAAIAISSFRTLFCRHTTIRTLASRIKRPPVRLTCSILGARSMASPSMVWCVGRNRIVRGYSNRFIVQEIQETERDEPRVWVCMETVMCTRIGCCWIFIGGGGGGGSCGVFVFLCCFVDWWIFYK